MQEFKLSSSHTPVTMKDKDYCNLNISCSVTTFCLFGLLNWSFSLHISGKIFLNLRKAHLLQGQEGGREIEIIIPFLISLRKSDRSRQRPTLMAWLAKPRPSCRQATMASVSPQWSLHTDPQRRTPFTSTCTSTTPSAGLRPPAKRTCNGQRCVRSGAALGGESSGLPALRPAQASSPCGPGDKPFSEFFPFSVTRGHLLDSL